MSSPSQVLRLSQQAPSLLQKPSPHTAAFRPTHLTSTENAEDWIQLEQLFLSCLQTGNDQSAHLFLERLIDRFGTSNERVLSLHGLYREAVAEDDAALARILKDYDDLLAEDPSIISIAKRRVSLQRTLSRPQEAIAALVTLLDTSPTDAEAWLELAELYFSLGLYSQAVYSMEEVLLIAPNAWNLQARMGEILYAGAVAGSQEGAANSQAMLLDAMRRFCRSVELCDGYLRGCYGLKMTTRRLLQHLPQSPTAQSGARHVEEGESRLPSLDKVQRLDEYATSVLSSIIALVPAGDARGQSYHESEVIAARQLLDSEYRSPQR